MNNPSATQDLEFAPGWPGIEARWTSSSKDGVGTALGNGSRIWFALSHGIINEVYYPRVDHACTRDMEFIVTDGADFFSEEKRDTETTIEMVAPGVPLFRITNRCRQGRYTLVKEIFADAERNCLIETVHLEKWNPELRLFVLLAPHINNQGMGNSGMVGDHKGTPLLFASRDNTSLALACSTGWVERSVGFVGSSDGWQDLQANGCLTKSYRRAENGNVALTGEISLPENDFTLVLGFGNNTSESGYMARAALAETPARLRSRFIEPWKTWQQSLSIPSESDLCRTSAAVLRIHEDKDFRGGTIASLSIPWGSSKGDNDLGGYHLVWPRDLCETAGGLIAAGAGAEARRVLSFLHASQEADGHWGQNMWLDGSPYWHGVQMDEVALPILLVDLAWRHGVLKREDLAIYWPMVKKAAAYIIKHGPVTSQDRWEEDAGISPFTLSAEIASLVVTSDLAELMGGDSVSGSALATADLWYSKIDQWTYAANSELAKKHGVSGYYVRIAPPEVSESGSPLKGFVAIKNRPYDQSSGEAVEIVSPDALALVRFGLRMADDPRIVDTVKVIDALLKRDLPGGTSWCRYNGDGYGEHEDGSSFDGTGLGRPWPLLTGERGHYELAAGNRRGAEELAEAMRRFSNGTGLIPEQVWDAADIPERELFCGRPTGSAMPLVWAHAEYIKLVRSIQEEAVFDLPGSVANRYLK